MTNFYKSILSRRHYFGFVVLGISMLWASVCFAENTNHPSTVNERIVVSLQAINKSFPKNEQDPVVKTLGGLGWVEGFVIDRVNHDILLFGKGKDGWPSLTLDDLVVNIRNVWNRDPYPYCSLDPQPENIQRLNLIAANNRNVTSVRDMKRLLTEFRNTIGPQMVRVGGVPPTSHHAHVMLTADYHMKKLSQGLVTLDGIPSILDLSLSQAKQAILQGKPVSSGASMSRLWFHIDQGHPTFRKGKDIISLEQCSVVVLTAKQRAMRDGELVDSGEDDPLAKAFATRLSKKFQDAATLVPSYANLENLYRLQALLKAMYVQGSVQAANLDLSYFVQRHQYSKEYPNKPSFPGLVNGKVKTISLTKGVSTYEYTLFPMAAGGVSMEIPNLRATQFFETGAIDLEKLRKRIINSRPRMAAVTWKVSVR